MRLPSPGAFTRLAVAAALTAYIFWRSDPGAVGTALVAADWRFVGIAALLVLADRAVMAYRWVVLLCIVPARLRPPLADLMRIFFVSTFVGTFLPATVGGDAVRAYAVSKLNVGGGDAIASVLMDRLLGVASLLLMAAAGLIIARDLASNPAIVSALAATAALCVLTLLVIFSPAAAGFLARVVGRLPAAVRGLAARALESGQRYAEHHRPLGQVLAGSVGVQVLRVVQAFFLGLGLGIAAPLSAYFAFVPLILLVMLLPVTVNGIGTSQAAFVWFFGRVGVPPADAFALSVLFVALGIVGNLPGAILYVSSGTWRARS